MTHFSFIKMAGFPVKYLYLDGVFSEIQPSSLIFLVYSHSVAMPGSLGWIFHMTWSVKDRSLLGEEAAEIFTPTLQDC